MRLIVCGMDPAAEGQTKHKKRTWRWRYHDYLGLTFVKADGGPTVNQNPPKGVWRAVNKWLNKRDNHCDHRRT